MSLVNRRSLLAVSVVVGVALCVSHRADAKRVKDNPELAELHKQDQADREGEFGDIDWSVVGPRDEARQRRVRELLDADAVHTANDYYHAAMVYQHANGAEGVQLAHELAMIAAVLGNKDAPWLAAASYDRFLVRLGRPQRFGTQYSAKTGEPIRLDPIDTGVTDAMRAALDCPTLEEAKEREKLFQQPGP